MTKLSSINITWLSVVLLFGVTIIYYFFSSIGLDRCYWNYIDSDFCYSVASLRFIDNYSTGFVEHTAAGEGLPIIQLLGWFYVLMSKLGYLGNPSFIALSIDTDPLVYLQQFVVFGWLFSGFVYLITIVIVFYCTRLLTNSNVISVITSFLIAVSWSNIQFLLRIRPEAFSAALALLSLYFMFKANKSSTVRGYAFNMVISSTALVIALFAKRNAMPYVGLLPIGLFVFSSNAVDRSGRKSKDNLLKVLITTNLVLFPPLLPLMSYWPQFIGSFTFPMIFVVGAEIIGFVLLIFFVVFLIFVVRSYKNDFDWFSIGNIKLCLRNALIYLLLLSVGMAIASYIGFVHHNTINRYTTFVLVLMFLAIGLGVSSITLGWKQKIRILSLRMLQMYSWSFKTVILTCFVAGLWIYVWYMFSNNVDTQIAIAVSRSLFEIVHPSSSMSLLSYEDNNSIFNYLLSVYGSWFKHYMTLRWSEMLIVFFTIAYQAIVGFSKDMKTVIFLVFSGMMLIFFSALRLLYPFYIIYEDLLTVIAIAVCVKIIIESVHRISHVSSLLFVFALSCVVSLTIVSSTMRIQKSFYMYTETMEYGCDFPPSGDTCMCDVYYAGNRFGGTGFKGIIERQYGLGCMESVELRSKKGDISY